MEKGKINSFKDLIAWQKAHVVVLIIYKIVKLFPKDEQYGLISQMRRCAISISSNIAEGFSRKTAKDKSQFYSIALGSVTELQNQLQVVLDVRYISQKIFEELDEKLVELHKLINGLYKSTQNRP